MNDRIKEFARKAGFKVNWQHADVQAIKMAQYREFAELIVRECVQVCDDTRKLTWTVPLKDDEQITACICMIKKHFGVQE